MVSRFASANLIAKQSHIKVVHPYVNFETPSTISNKGRMHVRPNKVSTLCITIHS